MTEYAIDSLLTGDRPIRVIPFPGERGKGKQVGLWVLTNGENREARVKALEWIVSKSGLSIDQLAHDSGELLDEEKKIQILFRALRDPSQPERGFARTVEILREGLTSDEIQALFVEYLDWVTARSPLRSIQTPEELDALVNGLGKGLAEVQSSLQFYDTVSLRNIVRSLAERLVKLTRESSSALLFASDTQA